MGTLFGLMKCNWNGYVIMSNKIIIEYSPEGLPISDFKLGEWCDTVSKAIDKNSINISYKFSTENIINAIYCNILNGDLPFNKIMFKYGKYEIYVRESDMRFEFHRGGKVTDEYPAGFLEVSSLQKVFIYQKLMR